LKSSEKEFMTMAKQPMKPGGFPKLTTHAHGEVSGMTIMRHTQGPSAPPQSPGTPFRGQQSRGLKSTPLHTQSKAVKPGPAPQANKPKSKGK
jgi:hypothetical protein